MNENAEKKQAPTFEERRILTGDGHFHFITVTREGLEILGEPSGEKTVITDLASVRSLNAALLDWLQVHTCTAFLIEPTGRGVRLPCELKRGHSEEMHFARRYTPDWTMIVGAVYWSDDNHAPEFHAAK